jgi:hypothetical protein
VSNNNDLDPAASTQMFQAFVERGEANSPTQAGRSSGAASGSGGSGKVIGIVVALVVIVAVVAFVALHK